MRGAVGRGIAVLPRGLSPVRFFGLSFAKTPFGLSAEHPWSSEKPEDSGSLQEERTLSPSSGGRPRWDELFRGAPKAGGVKERTEERSKRSAAGRGLYYAARRT